MSWQVQKLVWPIKLPTAEKFTLLALANYCRADGSHAYPSIETLVEDTGLSRRTVSRALASLIELNLIEVTRRSTRHTATVYNLHLRGATMTPITKLDMPNVTSRHAKTPPLDMPQWHTNLEEPFIEPGTAISKKKKSGMPAEARALLNLNPIFRDRSV